MCCSTYLIRAAAWTELKGLRIDLDSCIVPTHDPGAKERILNGILPIITGNSSK
jgi:hypothetical protein